MGIFNNDMEISKERPFKNDLLRRENEIINLTNLFEFVDNQMVLAVNSPWGTGKTTFLKMWEAYLTSNEELKSKYEVMYFNAWKNDDCLDPLVAIIGEMKDSIQQVNITNWDNIKSKGMRLGKKMLPIAIKLVTAGIVSSSDIPIGDKMKDALIDVSGNLFDVDEYVEQKEIRKEFEKELKEYQEKLGKTVIFFIDELDRCRPTFAIETLERVKHLFNLENFIFVLGIDKESLSNSIKVIYGNGTDIDGYLTRFIDLEYSLNQIHMKYYVECLIEKYFRNKVESNLYNNLSYIVPEILELFNLSLRDMEKIIVTLYLILKSNKNDYDGIEMYIIPFLLILSKTDKSLYNKFKSKNVNVQQLIEILEQEINIEKWINENRIGPRLVGSLISILYDINMYNKLKDEIEKYRLEGKSDKAEIAEHCVYSCYIDSRYSKIKASEQLEKIIKLVDIYGNFDINQ